MEPITIAGLVGAGAVTAYNAISSWWNNKYQRYQQQETWNREDTAIQRQVADAEKAGFNKFAVMGNNGASAGATVSTTPAQIDEGASGKLIDALNAGYQTAFNKASAEKAKAEAQIAENSKSVTFKANQLADMQIASDMVQILRQNGINANFGATVGKNGKPDYKPLFPLGNVGWDLAENGYYRKEFENTPIGQEFDNFYKNNKAQAEINETVSKYKDEQIWAQIIGSLLGGAGNAVNAGANLKRAYKGKKQEVFMRRRRSVRRVRRTVRRYRRSRRLKRNVFASRGGIRM